MSDPLEEAGVMTSLFFCGHTTLPRCFGFFDKARTLGNFFNASHLFGVITYVKGLTFTQKTSIISINGSKFRHSSISLSLLFINNNKKYPHREVWYNVSYPSTISVI